MPNFIDKYFGRMGNRLFQMAYIYSQARDGVIPDFYVQDPKFFEKYDGEIKDLFRQKGDTLDYVSIHVRRGKNPSNPEEPAYHDNQFYVNLMKTDYYKEAMAMFPNHKFLVFSDDMEWVRKQEIFKECEFFESGNEMDDFNAMARCRHNIIANSSFSWWAAYLNRNKDKKVIAPKAWYADGVERTVCPKEWIRV